MAKCGWSVVSLATLILALLAVWSDSLVEGSVFQLADTNRCLSWGPDAKSTSPGLVPCADRVTQQWGIGENPSTITGAKCLTVCVGGGEACTVLRPPQQDVNLTSCVSGPTPDSQLWETRQMSGSASVQIVSLQNNKCLTAGDGILTDLCGGKNQLWNVRP